MLHRFLVTEGMRADDPTADLDGIKVPAGIPKPLTEAEVAALLAAPPGDEPVARRDRALLELLYATGAGSRSCRASTSTTSTSTAVWSVCTARAPRSGSSRSAGCVACARGVARRRRSAAPGAGAMGAARRLGTVFLNPRGVGSAARSAGRSSSATGGRPASPSPPVAARAAPLVRHPPARPRRRPAHRPGAARPRVDLDHAGVHQGQPGAAVGRLSRGAPPRPRAP